jgi:hypothetical protein
LDADLSLRGALLLAGLPLNKMSYKLYDTHDNQAARIQPQMTRTPPNKSKNEVVINKARKV